MAIQRRGRLNIGSNDETWPAFPFTIAIDQSSPTLEWLQFSNGGQNGTQQQGLILWSLLSNLSTTFAISPTDVLSEMSSVSESDVFVTFQLTPQLLTAKTYSAAVDKVATYIKQWGSKELDFEVGSGPHNVTTEGIFRVRLGQSLSTAGIQMSTPIPSRSLSVPASNVLEPSISSTLIKSSPPSSSPGLPNALQASISDPLIKSNPSSDLPGISSPPPSAGSFSSPGSPVSTQSAPVTSMTGGAGLGSVSAAGGSSDTDRHAAAAGAAAAATVLTAGGSIAAAVAAAGEAASAAVVAAGGDSAAAAAASTAAEQVVKSSEESDNEVEEENQRVSFDNQRQATATSGAPAILNLATTGSVVTSPTTIIPTTSAPAIVTTTPLAVPSNGTMISQAISSTCVACVTCPGFEFGAKWPYLGSTASWADSDVDTEDDWDSDEDGDEFSPEDADGEEGDVPDSEGVSRRAFGRRFFRVNRFSRFARKKRHLHKRRVTAAKYSRKLGQCTGFTNFVSKPSYYNAKNVVDFENNPKMMQAEDAAAMNALLKWAIPIRTPPGDCTTVPKWTYLTTAQCRGDAPLPDGSTFSKVVGVGEPVWAVGVPPDRPDSNRLVNIDHVFEAKYLMDFFSDLNENQGFSCDYLKNVWDSDDGSKLTDLFAHLPSKINGEFIGMSKDLNSLKEAVTNKIWKKDLPLSWEVRGQKDKVTGIRGPDRTVGLAFTIVGKDAEGNAVSFDPANDLEELTTAAQLLDVINTPEAIAYMSAPNDRIYLALRDEGVPCQGGPSWADRYKSYLLDRFATRNVQLQDLFTRVLAEIGPGYRTDYMAAWKTVYPLERLQLPPPTSWAAELPAIQQGIQAKFARDPASLGKRQAAAPAAAAACMLNAGATAGNASSTGFRTSTVPIVAGGVANTASTLVSTPKHTTSPAPVVAPSAISLKSTSPVDAPPATSLTSVARFLAPAAPPATSLPSVAPVLVPIAPPATSLTSIAPVIAPVAIPPATSLTSTAASAAPIDGDPCGPAIQDNPNYPNTCDAKVNLVTAPATYGVYCGSDGPNSVDWAACGAAYSETCSNIPWAKFPKGAWVWTDSENGCVIGVWMPAGTDGAGSGAAMTPSVTRCTDLIFSMMTGSCSLPGQYNVASVKLNTLPSFTDPTQTGSQLNVGYPSYIIAGEVPAGLNQLPDGMGWSTAQYVDSPSMNANNQDGTTGSTTAQAEAGSDHGGSTPENAVHY